MDPIFYPGIEVYAEEHSSPEPDHLASVAAATRELSDDPGMMVGHLEGRFLKLLIAMLQPQKVLEIGTFMGYSSLAMAEALPPGAGIVTLDVNERHAGIAREHIAASPYANRILVRLGPALETLRTLAGPFDFVFIDADKSNYANYYDAVLPKLSDRGIIAVDNVLWHGRIFDETDQSEDTVAIRAFNKKVRDDRRVECILLTIRDGLTLIRKRS